MTHERWTDQQLDKLAYHGDDRYRRLKTENQDLRARLSETAENFRTIFESCGRK